MNSIWILDGIEKGINISKKEKKKDILEIWNEIYERFKKTLCNLILLIFCYCIIIIILYFLINPN